MGRIFERTSNAKANRSELLSAREKRIVLALAIAAIPPGSVVPGADEGTLERFLDWFEELAKVERRAYAAMLHAVEWLAFTDTGNSLTNLSREAAIRFVEQLPHASAAKRGLIRALLTPIKMAHFDDAAMFEAVGCPGFHQQKPLLRVAESPRWLSQVTDGREVSSDLLLEAEVVVIGSGAGGAACAYELASRGRAVLLLEEGPLVRRDGFNGRSREMVRKLYRDRGMTMAFGNVATPVWAGRGVGGSTAINSGTCYRASDRVFRRWRDEMGLVDFSSTSMAPYYEKVERMLQVTRAKIELTGGVGRVIARGAEKLGLSHHPLDRNAPDCDGQGVCAFGCPTGAKRSTDVSYVPEALLRGAQMVCEARVDNIDVVAGKARGVRGRLASGRSFSVGAQAVVVAAGALMTPVLFQRMGLLKEYAWLGKNLSIHPAAKVMAVFDETIDMATGIPQGYTIDAYEDEGLMFEGASTPLDVTAMAIPWSGRQYVRLMEQYRHLANFGFMIEDTSRGRVRASVNYSPLITYRLNDHDAQRIVRGLGILSEVFLAAGARRVLPFLPGAEEIRSKRDLKRIFEGSFSARDLEITAFHPLGTCRIGTRPENSVLSPEHETHGVDSLYVVDGSAVPSSLGVNPQMTIMAMAHRAGEMIDSRLA